MIAFNGVLSASSPTVVRPDLSGAFRRIPATSALPRLAEKLHGSVCKASRSSWHKQAQAASAVSEFPPSWRQESSGRPETQAYVADL